jgi:hypothetical protein
MSRNPRNSGNYAWLLRLDNWKTIKEIDSLQEEKETDWAWSLQVVNRKQIKGLASTTNFSMQINRGAETFHPTTAEQWDETQGLEWCPIIL